MSCIQLLKLFEGSLEASVIVSSIITDVYSYDELKNMDLVDIDTIFKNMSYENVDLNMDLGSFVFISDMPFFFYNSFGSKRILSLIHFVKYCIDIMGYFMGFEILYASLRNGNKVEENECSGVSYDFLCIMQNIGSSLGFVDAESVVCVSKMKGFASKKELDFGLHLKSMENYSKSLHNKTLVKYRFNINFEDNKPKIAFADNGVMQLKSLLEELEVEKICVHAELTGPILFDGQYLDDVPLLEIDTVEDYYVEEEKKSEVHFGQEKLLLSNLVFSYNLFHLGITFDNIYMLGCGNSQSTEAYIRFMGKSYKYVLIDPILSMSFYRHMQDNGYILDLRSDFAMEDMEILPNSIMISDIRTSGDNGVNQNDVHSDNYLQFKLFERFKAASIKFKVPYDLELRDFSYKVPVGELFLQPKRSSMSHEVRLFCYDPGYYRYMLVKEFWDRNNKFNSKLRFSGMECYDCRMAERYYYKFDLPVNIHVFGDFVKYAIKDGGYVRLVHDSSVSELLHKKRVTNGIKDSLEFDELVLRMVLK